MKLIITLSLLLVSSLSIAAENNDAFTALQKLSHSLRTLNFSTSFVVIKNNNAEPYHWAHGITEDNIELEVLSVLNGPHRDIVRRNNIVSYLEMGNTPHSINSAFINSPIPEILSGNTTQLNEYYDFVSLGRSRILGRTADSIRIVSKDPYRFNYWLWLDQESGLLLKLAVMNKQGQVLEQVQFTHLELNEAINPSLQQVKTSELPKVIDLPEEINKQEHPWQAGWLPVGFKQINANTHRIVHTQQPSEFKMFSDGLVDVSVYVSPSEEAQRKSGIVYDGATVVFNGISNNIEVSVVGKIPAETAQKIADSITFNLN